MVESKQFTFKRQVMNFQCSNKSVRGREVGVGSWAGGVEVTGITGVNIKLSLASDSLLRVLCTFLIPALPPLSGPSPVSVGDVRWHTALDADEAECRYSVSDTLSESLTRTRFIVDFVMQTGKKEKKKTSEQSCQII